MAYGENTPPAQRIGTLLVVLLLHGAVAALVLLFGTVTGDGDAGGPPLETFDIALPEPPEPQVDIDDPDQATPREEGAASEENIESEAAPVVASRDVEFPVPSPIPASPTPNAGRDPTQGASNRPGEGTGAGGRGQGTGSGNQGTGRGGGGGTRPSVVKGTTLTARDYPRELRRRWPQGGRVLVAVRVQVDGRATNCRVNVTIGDPQIDAATCRLVEERVRFNPARNARGEPYVAWYGYMQYNPG